MKTLQMKQNTIKGIIILLVVFCFVSIGIIYIYNPLGEIVLQTKSKNKIEKFDVSNLNDGIYFITIKTASGISSQKIIINH
jgi:uncharacterized membrane protein YcfT